MSRTYRNNDGDRRLRVKGVRRNPPDLRRLSRALIELAIAQAEQEATAESEAQKLGGRPTEARHDDAPSAAPDKEDDK